MIFFIESLLFKIYNINAKYSLIIFDFVNTIFFIKLEYISILYLITHIFSYVVKFLTLKYVMTRLFGSIEFNVVPFLI